jgi:hypothetical protein
MGRRAQGAAHREGTRRTRRRNPRARSREEELAAGTRERKASEVRVRKNVRTNRESVEVPTCHEEVSVERVLLSAEASEAEIGEDEVVVPGVPPEAAEELSGAEAEQTERVEEAASPASGCFTATSRTTPPTTTPSKRAEGA